MKNKKAQVDVGQLIIFIVVVGIAAVYIYTVYLHGGSMAAEALYRDQGSSLSLLADGIVNSPSCLAYAEPKELLDEKFVESKRGVIDWSKASDSLRGCVSKGPYVWTAVVKDKVKKQTITVDNFGAECIAVGVRTIPVLVRRAETTTPIVAAKQVGEAQKTTEDKVVFNEGEVSVTIASRDALVSIVQKDVKNYELTITNTGSCASGFTISSRVENPETGDFHTINQETTGVIFQKAQTTVIATLPDRKLNGSNLKVEISPEGMENYKKIYTVKL